MSYWVYLRNASGNCVIVPRHREGGTIMMGGNTGAELNVTYNYAKYFNFQALQGLTGARAEALLSAKMTLMLTEFGITACVTPDQDYWKVTPGNAYRALRTLLGWAKLHPEAIFTVS